ncbi:MAG: class I SAM-dependent methyltransferase [bacterium]
METFLDPNLVLDQAEIIDDMLAVDFGCGSGGWAIPLAKRLKNGMVFAVDLLPEPLSALEGKIKAENLDHIHLVKANVESENPLPLIKENSLDLVLMTNLLFQVDDKKQPFLQAKRVLKTDGRILVVDWKSDSKIGPEKKVSPEEVKKIGEELGLTFEKEFSAGAYHWALILVKQ